MAETPIRAGTPADDALVAGRAAIERHAWREAFDRLGEADAASALGGADLESLSTAATFSAEAQAGSEVKERAYRAYVVEGNVLRAAYLALDIAHEQFWAGRHSMASAWMRKAEQHLKDLPESYAYGFLVLARSELASMAGNLDEALTLAEQAIEIGDRVSDADLTAFAQTNLGFLKISSGDTEAGFALMEEASIAAVNDELSPVASGITCCRMISACRDLTDYQRATEWIEATESYCKRQSVSGFPGVCRIHRAEVKAIHGAWDTAEQDLIGATDRARRLQRGSEPGGGLLRDRGHPAPARRLRRRRGRPARGARPGQVPAAGPRARSASHKARPRRRSPGSTPPSPRRTGTAGRAAGCCRRRWRSPWPPAISRSLGRRSTSSAP